MDELHIDQKVPLLKRKLSFRDLYQRCAEIEDRYKPSRRHFHHTDNDNIRKAIQRLRERPKKYAVPEQRQAIVAEAYGLPTDFFENKLDLEEVNKAYGLGRQVPNQPNTSLRPLNFLRVTEGVPIPRSRLNMAEGLAELLEASAPEAGTVLILEGPAMVGKSFFLAHWARDHVAGEFLPALLVDCSSLSIDQIIPAITLEFEDLHAFRRKGKLPKLVVLDGLRLRNFREGTSAASVQLGKSMPRFADLMDLANALTEVGPSMVVVLVIENDGAKISDSLIFRHLRNELSVHHRQITPLDQEEAEKLFRSYLQHRLPEPVIREAVAKMGGMPVALIAEASRANELGAVAYEGAMRSMAMPQSYQLVEMADYFRARYPLVEGDDAVADEEGQLHTANPLALLRLLALMPGPVTSRDLAEIIRLVEIRRLGRFADVEGLAKGLPFVFRVEDAFDLHALAREHFASELDSFVANDQYDAFTSRDELLEIHWKAASIAWRMLSKDIERDRLTVASVWHFVYHILQMIRLLPSEPERSGEMALLEERPRQADPFISDKRIEDFLKDARALSHRELWNFAYARAARPYLLDKGKSATRLHGQFESKARIIEALIPKGVNADLAPLRVLVEMHFEAAICWMHSGRLQSANTSLHLALRALRKSHPSIWNFVTRIAPDTSGHDVDDWRVVSSLASLQAVLGIRLGRHGDETRADLNPFVDKAIELLRELREGSMGKSREPLAHGAVRIVSRWAELELYAGNIDSARAFYDQALDAEKLLQDKPQKLRGRPHLSGERARRYVALLLRSQNEAAVQQAKEIVDQNIAALEIDSELRGFSNDFVPFYVARASVLRALGDTVSASRALQQARDFDAVRRRQCTYMSLLEIEMESVRQKIVVDAEDISVKDDLANIIARAEASHHLLIACDAYVLRLETEASSGRRDAVRKTHALLTQSGYLMRTPDLELILDGRSAVKVLHV